MLPDGRPGDRLFAFLHFLLRHRRLPRRRPLFNDVLYAIKASDEILDPLRTFVSDKEFVKLYVKAVVGDQFNVPTVALLRSPNAVDRFDFPPTCAIKPTHLTGEVILRHDAAPVDRDRIRAWFEWNHYHVGREANYRFLQPKVIVEPLVFERSNLEDFKVFCFRGKPRMIQVDLDRWGDHRRKYFDTMWNELPFSILYPRSTTPFDRPENLDEMLRVARALSSSFSFVRVDLYSDGSRVLVGEITNCPGNAGEPFIPRRGETEASKLIFDEGHDAAGRL